MPNRIDRDPAIYRGITLPEMNTIGLLAILSAVFSLIVFGLVFLSLFTGFLFSLATFLYTIFFSLMQLAELKRGKPQHFLVHWVAILKEKYGLGRAPFIHKMTTYRTFR